MLHTLQQLRYSALEWLDDPQGDEWRAGGESGRLDHYINLAYQDIVHEIDRLPVAYNVPRQDSSQVETITTVSTQREYVVGSGRRIVEVCPVDSAGRLEDPLEFVDWSRRNTIDGARRGHVYAFVTAWSTGGARLHLGFVDPVPPFATVKAFFLPQLERLAAVSQIPTEVPSQFHELITLRTALLCKVAENREMGSLAALYAELLNRMRGGLGRMDRHLGSRTY